MKETSQFTAPLQHFSNAYAALLKNLAAVPQVAALDSYQNVLGQELNQVAEQLHRDDVMVQANRQAYENRILGTVDDVTKQLGVTPALWENTAQKLEALNSSLNGLNEVQKVAFLNGQGVDVTAENFAENLGPKVMELITNPAPALAAAKALTPAPEAIVPDAVEKATTVNVVGEATPVVAATDTPEKEVSTENPEVAGEPAPIEPSEQQPKEAHKHDIQDSVVNFVSTLLTAAKGAETTITREEAAQLIADYPEKFSEKHSNEHDMHVLMESRDNFNKYDTTAQQAILESTIQKKKHHIAASDIIANLDELRAVPVPKFTANLEAYNNRAEQIAKQAANAAGAVLGV